MRTSSSVIFASLQLPCGMHHRWVTVAEAERLLHRGDCRRMRIAGGKTPGRTRPVYRLVPRPEPSASQISPCPITFPDTLANVGLVSRHDPKAYLKIKAVRTKVREYRGVLRHDPMFAANAAQA